MLESHSKIICSMVTIFVGSGLVNVESSCNREFWLYWWSAYTLLVEKDSIIQAKLFSDKPHIYIYINIYTAIYNLITVQNTQYQIAKSICRWNLLTQNCWICTSYMDISHVLKIDWFRSNLQLEFMRFIKSMAVPIWIGSVKYIYCRL